MRSTSETFACMNHEAFKWLWKSKSIPKIKVFGWFLLSDRLNTRNMLKRRHYNIGSNLDCLLCETHVEETVEHLFSTAPLAKNVGTRLGCIGRIKTTGSN